MINNKGPSWGQSIRLFGLVVYIQCTCTCLLWYVSRGRTEPVLVKIQSALHNSLPIAREFAVESCEKKMTFNLCDTILYGIGVMHGIVISNYGQFDSSLLLSIGIHLPQI